MAGVIRGLSAGYIDEDGMWPAEVGIYNEHGDVCLWLRKPDRSHNLIIRFPLPAGREFLRNVDDVVKRAEAAHHCSGGTQADLKQAVTRNPDQAPSRLHRAVRRSGLRS